MSKKLKKPSTINTRRRSASKGDLTAGPPLIEVVRNHMVESLHCGHLLILNKSGRVHYSLGKPNTLIYPRSAIKAIQTSAMVRLGLNLPAELIALVASSHIGSREHQIKVKAILATVGLDETALKNTPLPTSLAAPCSGKHAGMIVTAKINNWSLETYKDPKHPLQVAIRKELAMLSQESITKIAVDGCGAPLFAVTLRGLARAIHQLMVSTDPVHQTVINACRDYPKMVSGEGTLPTVAMESVPGLYLKTGAESVLAGGLADGQTIVWKISDGSERGAEELLTAALKRMGVKGAMPLLPRLQPDGTVLRALL